MNDLRNPKQKRGIETKESIIRAGLGLFCEKGFYHVDSKQIAEAAGVGTGTFYSYFKDKRDLFSHILLGFKALFNETLEEFAIKEYSSGCDMVRDLVFLLAEKVTAYPPRFLEEIMVVRYTDEDIGKDYANMKRVASEKIVRLLNKVGISGIGDAKIVAELLLDTNEAILVASSRFPPAKRNALLSEQAEMFRRYLGV